MSLEPERPKTNEVGFEWEKFDYGSAWRRILPFWLITRVGLSLLALFCSFTLPFSPLEKQVAVWPPSSPPGAWLTRVFLEPWNRWDVEHYLKIAARGYRADDGTSSFHPLHPLSGKVAGLLLGGDYLLGLFLVSNVCAVLFLICLERLASFDLPQPIARRVPFYFMMMPVAFILFAPYTEPLFLLCSTLCFIGARKGRWFWAGMAGGLAVLTRQQGIFLLIPLAVEFWLWAGATSQGLRKSWTQALNLLWLPASLLAWLTYRAVSLSDVSIDWGRPQTLIYGLLISKSAHQVVVGQSFMPPWQAISIAIRSFNATNAIDLFSGAFCALTLILGAGRLWRMRSSYLIFSVVVILVAFSYSTGSPLSYMGLPRHCLLAFPLSFLLADWGRNRFVYLAVSLLGSLWLIFLTVLYVFNRVWLP